ncbi:MAG: DUF3419 family protein [Gammaproteobacteria bacterium]|nr:DUF3419 family protein [Gammaproteobacteria bacterium]
MSIRCHRGAAPYNAPLKGRRNAIASGKPLDCFNGRVFSALCQRSLVYNTCREDPGVDRLALQIGPQGDVVAIASAGGNPLDYALAGPRSVAAADVNPRQNARLKSKLASIHAPVFDDGFALFGNGAHARFGELSADVLRPSLTPFARH